MPVFVANLSFEVDSSFQEDWYSWSRLIGVFSSWYAAAEACRKALMAECANFDDEEIEFSDDGDRFTVVVSGEGPDWIYQATITPTDLR